MFRQDRAGHHSPNAAASRSFRTLQSREPPDDNSPVVHAALIMAKRLGRDEFVRPVAERVKTREATAPVRVDVVLDTACDTFKRGKGMTLRGFGGLYPEKRRDGCTFKFNPGRKLRALHGR